MAILSPQISEKRVEESLRRFDAFGSRETGLFYRKDLWVFQGER
jgi:hypothetical protein